MKNNSSFTSYIVSTEWSGDATKKGKGNGTRENVETVQILEKMIQKVGSNLGLARGQ